MAVPYPPMRSRPFSKLEAWVSALELFRLGRTRGVTSRPSTVRLRPRPREQRERIPPFDPLASNGAEFSARILPAGNLPFAARAAHSRPPKWPIYLGSRT